MYTGARAAERGDEADTKATAVRGAEPVPPQAAAVLALQRQVGNHATSALLGGGRVLARDPDEGATATAAPDFAAVIADESISGIKAIRDFRGATDLQREQMIDILLDQFWVGPYDEAALERIWDSYGERLPDKMADNARQWVDCVDRGAELPRWTRWDRINLSCEIQPGVITQRQTERTRAAVERLGDMDYLIFRQLVRFAGSPMQMAFICKALAADRGVMEVAVFAATIRAHDDQWLLDNLAITADQTPVGGQSQTGVMQQWQMSCGPTNVQILHAETDPIYALSITSSGVVNDQTQSNTALTNEQGAILQGHGSTPTAVGTAGTGAWVESDLNALSNATGVTYTYTSVASSFPTNAADSPIDRAVSSIIAFLNRDIQVPIVIGQGSATTAVATSHYVMCLRAQGDSILIHDPGNGTTAWVTRAQFLGNSLAPPLSWPSLAGYDRPSGA